MSLVLPTAPGCARASNSSGCPTSSTRSVRFPTRVASLSLCSQTRQACSLLSVMAPAGGRPDIWLSNDRRSALRSPRFMKLLLCLALLGSTTASTLDARYDHAALPSGAGHDGTEAGPLGGTTKGYAWLIVVHGPPLSVSPFLTKRHRALILHTIYRHSGLLGASGHRPSRRRACRRRAQLAQQPLVSVALENASLRELARLGSSIFPVSIARTLILTVSAKSFWPSRSPLLRPQSRRESEESTQDRSTSIRSVPSLRLAPGSEETDTFTAANGLHASWTRCFPAFPRLLLARARTCRANVRP